MGKEASPGNPRIERFGLHSFPPRVTVSSVNIALWEEGFVLALMNQVSPEMFGLIALEKNMVDVLPIMVAKLALGRYINSYMVKKAASRNPFMCK